MSYTPNGLLITGLTRYNNNITENLVDSVIDWYVGTEIYQSAQSMTSDSEKISITIPIYCNVTRQGITLKSTFNVFAMGDLRNTDTIDILEGDLSKVKVGDYLHNVDIFYSDSVLISEVNAENNTIKLNSALSDGVANIGEYEEVSLQVIPQSPTKEFTVFAVKLNVDRKGSQIKITPKLAYFEGVGNTLDADNPLDVNFSNAVKYGNKLTFDYDSWLSSNRIDRSNCGSEDGNTVTSGDYISDTNYGEPFLIIGEVGLS
jgi:hypothetical protein